MAEEAQATETQEQTEQTQQAEQPTDWQAKYEAMRQHARDWEKQAKANKGAAEELEKLKTAQMTEQEKAVARAEKAETELAQLKAEAQRVQDVAEVAQETGVPSTLLDFLPDRETMERFAAEYAKANPIHAASRTSGASVVGEGVKPSNGDVFARFAKEKLNF